MRTLNDKYTVGKQTHDLTVTAIDAKITQSGGDNRNDCRTVCPFTPRTTDRRSSCEYKKIFFFYIALTLNLQVSE
jgi:hypothetical protein